MTRARPPQPRRRPHVGIWALLVALVTVVGLPACHADEHASTGEQGSTGGIDDAAAEDFEDDMEFEVDDPGATPPEVVDAERLVLQRLEDRRDDLDARELSLAKRTKSLDELDAEIETRLGNITKLEQRLQTQLGIGKVAHERRDERISALSELVATMTPQAGADLVSQLGDRDAQWILMSIARKNQRKAAKLMAAMPPDRAAQLGQLYLDSDPKSVPNGDQLGPIEAGSGAKQPTPSNEPPRAAANEPVEAPVATTPDATPAETPAAAPSPVPDEEATAP